MTSLGDRLRAARRDAGMTQVALAGRDASPSLISRIESGDREPGPELLTTLAQRLGVSARWLHDGESEPTDVSISLVLAAAEVDLDAGRPEGARQRLRSLDLDQVRSADRVSVAILVALAEERCGNYEACCAPLEPLWDAAMKERNADDVLTLSRGLAHRYIVLGRSDQALRLGGEAATLFADHPVDPDEAAKLGSTMIWARVEQGELVRARSEAHALLNEAITNGSVLGRSVVLWNLSLVERHLGHFEWAARYARAAVSLHERAGGAEDANFFRLHHHLATQLLVGDSANVDEAMEHLRVARSGLSRLATPVDIVNLDVDQSKAHLLSGEYGLAQRWAESAVEHRGAPTPLCWAEAALMLADSLIAQRKRSQAVEWLHVAAEFLTECPEGREVALLWRQLGTRLADCGASGPAAHAWRSALTNLGLVAGVRVPSRSGRSAKTGQSQGLP
ncbi:helix-turn-helix transcriptional regulator [Cellulomonas sp. NPDC089187]|uniref:helix-turn-helix domain-containing protein n=1 Tax=Cellulomonas sp. NPDC089187 TaxID=3154970 RepID=UPI0034336A56